jgi:hypothetical protein
MSLKEQIWFLFESETGSSGCISVTRVAVGSELEVVDGSTDREAAKADFIYPELPATTTWNSALFWPKLLAFNDPTAPFQNTHLTFVTPAGFVHVELLMDVLGSLSKYMFIESQEGSVAHLLAHVW